MPKSCINHKETPSVTMCHQCHHPLCKPCSLITPQGTFCSPECAILNRDFKEKLKEPKPKEMGGFFTKTAAAFVLMIVGFMGIHMAATHGMSKLKRIDVIGMILNLAARRSEGAPK